MIKVMEKYAKTGEWVAVYTNRMDTSAFIYGRIIAVNDTYIALLPVTKDGEPDGLLVKLCEDVFRIDAGGEYAVKMKKIMDFSNAPIVDYQIDAKNMIESVMRTAKEEHGVVSVELEESGVNDITGFVKEINEESAVLDIVDSYGYADGTATVRVSCISQIAYDGKDEKRISLLASRA